MSKETNQVDPASRGATNYPLEWMKSDPQAHLNSLLGLTLHFIPHAQEYGDNELKDIIHHVDNLRRFLVEL